MSDGGYPNASPIPLVLIFSLATAAAACGAPEEPAPLPAGQARTIVGGSAYSGLPAVGALVYRGGAGCTGTLIGPRKVLTAAHCLRGKSAQYMRFVIGPNAYSPQASIKAARLVPHPLYNHAQVRNDIGLVLLSQDAPVAHMGVLNRMDSSFVGKELFFVGYGRTGGYSNASGSKRAVWIRLSRVDSTTFRYSQQGRNTCQGDSGGPAFFKDNKGRYLVAGVTSHGDAYCNRYGVDTRVDRYLDFVGKVSQPAPAPQPKPQPQASGCKGETYKGRCSGGTVIWCEKNQARSYSCAVKGQTCGYDSTQKFFTCLSKKPADPCKGETYKGRCNGSTVVWCEKDQVNTRNCASKGNRCGWSPSNGYFGCI